jgi:hypothetical protein
VVHGNKMKIDNKRTWADVLKRLEKECYTVIPRETKAWMNSEQINPLRHYPA